MVMVRRGVLCGLALGNVLGGALTRHHVRLLCAASAYCAYARLWLPGASPRGEALSHGPQILARGPQICHLVEDDLDPAGREPLVRVHPVLCTARRAGLEVSRAREGLAPLGRPRLGPAAPRAARRAVRHARHVALVREPAALLLPPHHPQACKKEFSPMPVEPLCAYGREAFSPLPGHITRDGKKPEPSFAVVQDFTHCSTTMDHADTLSDATGDRDWDSGRLLRLVLTDSAAARAVWPPLVAYPPAEVREPRSG